ncbi:MAG: rod-binding protein [Desulfobacterales bacterium]|nr:rod-binding protein [Desulfobacterales bacterium]
MMTESIAPLTAAGGSLGRTLSNTGIAAVGPATGAGKTDPAPRRLASACAELESLFIKQLFEQMRATIPKSGLLGGGSTEALFTSMLDQEMAKELAARGGIGLASLLRDQLAGQEITKVDGNDSVGRD